MLLLSWIVTGAVCWWAYRLFPRYGRLLLRVEELEQDLHAIRVASAPVLYGSDARAALRASGIPPSRYVDAAALGGPTEQ